ncbi:EbsA family protein [Streptococcus porci]|uniref:EbsA family protein n=1 Tax=Streptococcus porci TaxID=502567 RepID=UPI000408C2A4|nr:EbsA family protein [Streptococcus porci]
MIKLFGKIRYHWQPELSWSLIYWSLTFMPIFIGLSLLYEKTDVPLAFFIMIAVFGTLFGLGLHRYFIIGEDGRLEIVDSQFWKKTFVPIADISKIEVTKTTLSLVLKNGQTKRYSMRKWPKKYFLDALVINPDFVGEVELLDNFIKLDYFEHYQGDKKAPTRL